MQGTLARLRAWAEQLAETARRRPRLAVLTLTVLGLAVVMLRLEYRALNDPIYGVHDWRQGWTYSVAYAFVHESASFFYPKHNWRGSLSGIVGMECPIYPYLLSLGIRVFGDAPIMGRIVNMVLMTVASAVQAHRLRQLLGWPVALGWLVMFALSPLMLCEYKQIQPDPMMAALCVLAAATFQLHGERGDRASFAWGLALFTLALLTKTIAVAVFPAMYLFAVLGKQRPSLRSAALKLASFALPLGLMYLWDRWAHELVARFMEGRSLISIDHDLDRMLAEAKDRRAQIHILGGLLTNWVTHVALMPAVIVGIVLSQRPRLRALGLPYLAWLLGMIAISLAFSSRYFANWYYMLLFGPPVLFFGGVGLAGALEAIGARRSSWVSLAGGVAALAAALTVRPLLTPLPYDRIEPVNQFLAIHVRQALSRGLPYWRDIGIAIAAGAIAVAALYKLIARVPDRVLALALAVALGLALERPIRDVYHSTRVATGEFRWETDRRDDREIRAAVERFSRYQDLFLVSGSNPGFLMRARRNGFADDPPLVDALGRSFYVERKARFFLTFSDSPPIPRAMQGLPLLAQGRRFSLFCLDPAGCPPVHAAQAHSSGLGGT